MRDIFTPALADGLPLEIEWQQVSSSAELFSVFWLILIIQLVEWSPIVLLFPSSPFRESILWWLCRVHWLQVVLPSLSCYKVFSILLTDLVTCISFCFLWILSVVTRDGIVHYSAGSLFLLTINRSGRLVEIWVISLYLNISENIVHLILYYKFWFVRISFACMVKFKFLEQFPEDNFPHPIVSALILFLR